jgi:mannose-6-phosphate isomerase-like protein (cupin superfamily)
MPIDVKHALRNPSESQILGIIGGQSGSYLGEGDIVCFEGS